MRTTMKGGVWKNSEDEILKAAVMKYGLNNWSRVASLLVRKSAKQCKSRWYEWLDPSVKKTEWTREEEEKLLHLAKLFPNQWRTIAPIVGRTTHQCLEHYEKLLDEAQGRTEEDRQNDPRRLRPGEIDPHPETKPSRADVIDMDDDEKEMLAEARARLANTRGKKAKRKAREKQLEEARRLAALQKRRELKAAGLGITRYKKRNETIDYATEIPFEQKPALGFYKVGAEETPASIKGFGDILLQQLEGQRRIDEERRLRREDTRKLKRIMDENPEQAMSMIDKINESTMIRKKMKLVLPEPQLSDESLREIIQLGKSQAPPTQLSANATGPSAHLLDFSSQQENTLMTPMNANLTTPMRTPAVQNTVLLAARDAYARTVAETPLEGGVNPELSNLSFGAGVDPVKQIPQTPNLLGATHLKTGGASSIIGTPSVIATPLPRGQESSGPQSNEKAQTSLIREKIRDALSQVPAPQNEIAIEIPDASMTQETQDSSAFEEDAEDILARETEKKSLAYKLKFASRAVQESLPRPMITDQMILDCAPFLDLSPASPTTAEATSLIQTELEALVYFENQQFPLKGVTCNIEKELTSGDLSLALLQVSHCGAGDLPFQEASSMIEKERVTMADCEEDDVDLDSCLNDFVFEAKSQSYVAIETASVDVKRQAVQTQCLKLRQRWEKDTKKIRKLEAKLTTLTRGYQQKIQAELQTIESAWNEVITAECEYEAYKGLEEQEQRAMQTRLKQLEERLASEQAWHNELQKHYAAVVSEYTELQAKLHHLPPTQIPPSYVH